MLSFKEKEKIRKDGIEKYIKQMEKERIWSPRTQERMEPYYRKSIDNVVELSNGDLVAIDKPSINTYLGTGYSDCGQGMSYEEANKVAEEKEKSFDYFIQENIELSNINHYIKDLNDKSYIKCVGARFYSSPKECKIKGLMFSKPWDLEEDTRRYNLTTLNEEDIEKLINGYKDALERYVKRLNTYLKRFGLEKCDFSTYWLDR